MGKDLKRKTINRGIKNWTKNCFRFYYQRSLGNLLCKRDKRLWLFSTWEGTKYADNSRYLYEYVKEYEKDIVCGWVTKNQALYDSLKAKGHYVLLVGTAECEEAQKKAGIVVFNHGLDDFGDFPYVFGARIVCPWHGIGIKKNYATLDMHHNKLKNKVSELKMRVFSYIYRDVTIATSEYIADTYRKETLTTKSIFIVGQPRNDVLSEKLPVNEVLSQEIISKYNLMDKPYRYIAYMPTYRGNKASQKFLEELVSEFTGNSKLNEILEKNNIKLLMKMHYLTDTSNMSFNDNIILIDDKAIECPQRLLSLSDMLITDYSTCATDFSLLDREVLFFTPDIEQYSIDNGVYDEFLEVIKPYQIMDIETLVKRVESAVGDDFKSDGVTAALNKLYNQKQKELGSYRKKIVEILRKKYRI